jgi:hypothetical protein
MKDISSAEPSFVLRLNNAMEMKNTGYESGKMRLRNKNKTPQDPLRGPPFLQREKN